MSSVCLEIMHRADTVKFPGYKSVYLEDVISVRPTTVEGLSSGYYEIHFIDRDGELKKSICVVYESSLEILEYVIKNRECNL